MRVEGNRELMARACGAELGPFASLSLHLGSQPPPLEEESPNLFLGCSFVLLSILLPPKLWIRRSPLIPSPALLFSLQEKLCSLRTLDFGPRQ